jgi:glycosyltransferase involved in cell wall biosynthesis
MRLGVKVALVHDWLITHRGGEKVLDALVELFPQAEIFTLFHEPGAMPAAIEARPIHTAFVDRLPGARSHHRELLPLLPGAIRSLDLSGFELVVSSSHCVAKGVRVPRGAPHLGYVHAPLRYMWERYDDYFGPGRATPWVRAAARVVRPAMRAFDVRTARQVDRLVANSENVARQIARHWGRRASVVHPPVELERFIGGPLEGTGRGGYFLCLGALAPYKRIDLAIEAFRAMPQHQLWIAGSGQARGWLEGLPPNVKALGQVSDAELPALYRGARALVFPGEEDFGLTPLEAQGCGRPVIALGRGGALETVLPTTGIFFPEPAAHSLREAVERFDAFEAGFRPEAARENAMRFSRGAFLTGIRRELKALGIEP